MCQMGTLPKIARAALHFWEEPCISGTRGSGTVFFSGCALGCRFCQNAAISHGGFGKVISIEQLCDVFRMLEQQGAHNINLVNPTHFSHAVLRALEQYRPSIPVVWNSGGYDCAQTLQTLEGKIDVYLPDLKYIDPALAQAASGADDYFEHARTAILEMYRQTGDAVYDENGMLQRGVIVRHLVLPGHINHTLKLLEFCRDNLPRGIGISVMAQYTPMAEIAGMPELGRRLTAREYRRVESFLFLNDMTNGYMQELSSAKEEYVPPFDLEGVP